MVIVSAISRLFRDPSAEQQNKKRLNRAELELAELECNLEATQAHVSMLKARIARLKGEAEVRPARTSIQAPHPGPGYTTTGEEIKEAVSRSKRLHATA